jgi:competence protein ComEC
MRRLLAALTLCLTLLCPEALPVPPQPATQTQPDPKVQTVYVTRTGKKYHRDGCRYLAASKSPISLKDAKAKGYTACKVCRPPE